MTNDDANKKAIEVIKKKFEVEFLRLVNNTLKGFNRNKDNDTK